MAFDLDLIKKLYSEMPAKVDAARTALGRPLTLAEKILFSHLWNGVEVQEAFVDPAFEVDSDGPHVAHDLARPALPGRADQPR